MIIFAPILRRLVPIAVCLYIVIFLFAQSPKILDYYRVSDDIRQQIYPLYLARDPELFKDDLLTRYFLSHTPPAYYWSHYPLAKLIDPVVLSKISQLALLALVLFFLYLIGRRLEGPILGWILIFLFLHSPALSGMTDGGLPRAYAVPAVVLLIWCALSDRLRLALAVTTIAAIFYPPILLVLGPSFVLWSLWTRQRPPLALCLGAFLVLFLGIYPMVRRAPEIGAIITFEEARQMPEWQRGSRFPFIPIPSLLELAPRRLSAAFLPSDRSLPWHYLLAFLGALGVFAVRTTKNTKDTKIMISLLVVSVVMYEVGVLLAFRLHIPDRAVIYSLPTVGLILISLPRISRIPVLVLSLVFWGTGLHANLNLWADQRFAADLYKFVAALPKDAVLAGPPVEMDNLPLFSQRKVFVSDEAAQPLYDNFYREMKRRLLEFYRAYYATDWKTIQDFARQNGVDYLLVKTEDFTTQFHRERYYYEPYNTYIQSLLANTPATQFVLSAPPPDRIIYDDGYFRLLQLR